VLDVSLVDAPHQQIHTHLGGDHETPPSRSSSCRLCRSQADIPTPATVSTAVLTSGPRRSRRTLRRAAHR